MNVSSHIARKARWQIELSMQFQKSMVKCREIVAIFYENLVFESVTLSLEVPYTLLMDIDTLSIVFFMGSEISSASKGAIVLLE